MTRKHHSSSAGLKLEAAYLIVDEGYAIPEACSSLNTPRHWMKQLETERSGAIPQGKALTPEQKRIQELEARINRRY